MEQLKVDNEVINHLLFHKSLIDEKDDATKINHYVSMLQKADDGEHISIENPFDRSIAIAFELVIQQHLDPWDIDLVNFSTMYLKRAKEEKIDLITAGRIIYMAWKVLKLQSDNLVVSMETQEETYEPFGWGDIPTEMWLSKDDAYSYTNLVMNMPKSPLDEPIRRDSKRKVTLMELLEAFDKARIESEEHQLLEQQRKEERERLANLARKRMKGTAHEDHLEEDVEAIWKRIKQFPKKTMTLKEICEKKGREELIKVLMSVLFLAYDNKVLVHQKKFPYGKIYIKNVGYS
ncbi:MAG: segregation/condensation protein A [Thermoplasmatales archaeon]|nr:segregation/condensation protein A [Thermoplasmatales archaeon]